MTDLNKFDFKKIKEHARELRKSMTDSEKLLWNELRGRKLSGYKFHRQYPILYNRNLIRYNYFKADFYCAEKKLIIELDGPLHDSNKEYDQFRDLELKNIGIHTLRIKNDDLSDMHESLQIIQSYLDSIV
ncbi:MAG: endonuclease domain-containing protein [Bacteroidales bacterium]|nr:endonuclease domain-containing protein [Bacteroidales bacterium]